MEGLASCEASGSPSPRPEAWHPPIQPRIRRELDGLGLHDGGNNHFLEAALREG